MTELKVIKESSDKDPEAPVKQDGGIDDSDVVEVPPAAVSPNEVKLQMADAVESARMPDSGNSSRELENSQRDSKISVDDNVDLGNSVAMKD